MLVLRQGEDVNPFYSFWALFIVVVETLKLVSYAHVNYWCRLALKEVQKNATR